jgi:hypothetical protein
VPFNPRRVWDDEGSVSSGFVGGGHCCGVDDLDYSLVAVPDVSGRAISCSVCGRVWRMKVLSGGRVEWWPFPCPGCGVNADLCKHYGKRYRKRGGSGG